MMSTARITVRIDQSLQERLKTEADVAGKTESDVMREALQDYLDRKVPVVTAYEAFKRAGVIGCVKGGPKDMSTNPKYMEDFGRD